MQYNIEEVFHSTEVKGYTFLQWLMLCKKGKVDQARTKEEQQRQIDEFVRNNVQIRPKKAKNSKNTKVQSAKEFTETEQVQKKGPLVSETLASVYIKQKKIHLALSVFRQLGLENPEKSTYFADLIAKATQEANHI